jgi:hypothetical protein
MPPAVSLNRSAAREASLDYGQQIHCVVIWVRRPLFHKWRLTDGILLFSWLAVERLQKCASHATNIRANREWSVWMAFNEGVNQRPREVGKSLLRVQGAQPSTECKISNQALHFKGASESPRQSYFCSESTQTDVSSGGGGAQ